MYTPVKLIISIDQHKKLKNAINNQKAVSIKVDVNSPGGKGVCRERSWLENQRWIFI